MIRIYSPYFHEEKIADYIYKRMRGNFRSFVQNYHKKEKDGIGCDTCGIKFPLDQLVHDDNFLICKACEEELKKTDAPIIKSEGETVIINPNRNLEE